MMMDPLTELFQEQQNRLSPDQRLSIQEELYIMERIKELKMLLKEDGGDEYDNNNNNDSELEDLYRTSEIIAMRRELQDLYVRLGQYDRATQQLKKYLETEKDVYGPVSAEACATQEKLRDILKMQQRWNEAASTQMNILQLKSRLSPLRHGEEARTDHEEEAMARVGAFGVDIGKEWMELGRIYASAGSKESSAHAYERAKDIFESRYLAIVKEQGEQQQKEEDAESILLRELYFTSLAHLGDVHYSARSHEKAFEYFEKAVSVPLKHAFVAVNGEQHPMREQIIEVYSNMGNCCLFLGKTGEAEQFYKLAIDNSHSDSERLASLLHSLGVLYGTLSSQYSNKSAEFEKDVQLSEKYTLEAVKILKRHLEQQRSVPLNTSALSTPDGRRKLKQMSEYVQCHMTLGSMYNKSQRMQQAEQCFRTALDMLDEMQRSFAGNHAHGSENAVATTVMPNLRKDMAYIYNQIAQIHQRRNRVDEAMETYKQAKTLAKLIQDKTNPVMGTICRNLGVLYMNEANHTADGDQKQELYKLAEQNMNEAADLFSNAYPTEYHPDLGDISGQLARLMLKTKDYTKAVQHIEDSIDTYLIVDHPKETRIDESIHFMRECGALWRKDLDNRLERPSLSDEDRREIEINLDYLQKKLESTIGKEKILFAKRAELDKEKKLQSRQQHSQQQL